MSVRLLIVDDHETVREGLRYAFEGNAIETVEATNGATALAVVFSQQIDIVLLDVGMPDLDGLEVLNRIKQQRPDLPVLMYSCHDRLVYVKRSIMHGAAGYLIKSPHASEVVEAVRIALDGGNVWTPAQLRHATSRDPRRFCWP